MSEEVESAPHNAPREPLTQRELMWRKFKQNKMAIVGGVVLIIMYSLAILAEFIAPHGMNERHYDYIKAPPQRVQLIDEEGNFRRPFVYGYRLERDPETLRRHYNIDHDARHEIQLFVRGEPYSMLGLFESDLRLMGVEDAPLFLMGTDRFGRDMLVRILVGGRISLSVGLVGVIISIIIGSIMGSISGFYGGSTDRVIQRVIEFIRSFPQIPLWMTLSAALPPDWSSIKIFFGITIILSFIGWTGLAREVRGKVIAMRENEAVLAARSAGASDSWIILRHLLPSSLSHILVVATLAIPSMILGEASLSFLGLGIRPPMTSWGVLLQEAQNVRTLAHHPWLFIPAFFIVITILSFNFLGDGLRDAADPFSQ